MRKPNFRDELKRDAVARIVERGYAVAKVSQRLCEHQKRTHADIVSSAKQAISPIGLNRPVTGFWSISIGA